MSHWAYYHGWSMGPWFFEPLSKHLGGTGWFFDRGYNFTPSVNGPESGPWNLVTHSMGLWFIPTSLLKQTNKLVILGGFRQFIPCANKPRQQVKRYIKQLEQGLISPLETGLNQFFSLCQSLGSPALPLTEPYDVGLLLKDLTRLSTEVWSGDLYKKKILLIQGEQDQVTLSSQAIDLAHYCHCTPHWLKNTGHDYHYSQPKKLAQLILQFVNQ